MPTILKEGSRVRHLVSTIPTTDFWTDFDFAHQFELSTFWVYLILHPVCLYILGIEIPAPLAWTWKPKLKPMELAMSLPNSDQPPRAVEGTSMRVSLNTCVLSPGVRAESS